MASLPLFIAPARFDDPEAALAQVCKIYDNSIGHLRGALQQFVAGTDLASLSIEDSGYTITSTATPMTVGTVTANYGGSSTFDVDISDNGTTTLDITKDVHLGDNIVFAVQAVDLWGPGPVSAPGTTWHGCTAVWRSATSQCPSPTCSPLASRASRSALVEPVSAIRSIGGIRTAPPPRSPTARPGRR